ncbi:enoyl-CoA hydratase/carnithine racemase [Comamonas odontotermitis]|uniref:Enoyl-CoA hydratase/carnithine racemase n=1 Tax=Comamonas odontotermitis TaxID=379895 RepID=A0ABR6RBL1_9BURK|nr:enoyl-CoA hydratase [Comamonas odontotermitis]MBB6576536.1 enoyl-CoA hydratase/carnithine racemase [Comamonas odontotermitis]
MSLIDLHHAHATLEDHGVATLTFRNAGSLNILSSPVLTDLAQAFDALSKDERIRVLVLRGSGDKAFVAGADIKEMRGLNADNAAAFITRLRTVCEAARQFPTPVIARLPGWTLGGGLELACACDIRIASNRVQCGMPEVKVGIPSVIHAALLPRLIGAARAQWLLLTGDNIDAAQSLQWGLLDHVVAPDRLDEEVERLAKQLAGYGPQALRQQKRMLRAWEKQSIDAAIDESVQEFANAFKTGEPQTYMASFGAKH